MLHGMLHHSRRLSHLMGVAYNRLCNQATDYIGTRKKAACKDNKNPL